VNTHSHLWQTAYRTIASNTSLWEYFNRYSEYASSYFFEPEDVYIGQLMGLYEALDAGTTTTLDHAHHTWDIDTSAAGLQATIDSGGRCFWAYAFHDVEGFTVEEQLANLRSLAESDITKGTRTELGVAYDAFGPNPNVDQTSKVVALAKSVQPPLLAPR
jgi:cytosine/adenosine deaminase-related metal-dependent hydrolase